MATLKDLSRHLGISVTQVSRALNGHDDVSLKTRQRVEEAAKALNYAPNISARKLASGRSGIVALVHRNHPDMMDDPTFMHTIVNLSITFSKINKQFVLHLANEGDKEIDIYQRLISNGAIDGFVISSPKQQDERIEYLLARAIPFVVHGQSQDPQRYAYFDIDNFQVGRRLTQVLLDAGLERIALINGPAELSFSVARTQGYCQALKDYGIDFKADYVRCGHMSERFGMLSAIKMLTTTKQPPQAIIASNLRIARGIYQAAEALELRIPDDLSLVAHDDVLPKIQASAFSPALTVTRSQLSDSWQPLTQALSRILEGDSVENHQIMGNFELIKAQSHKI